MSISERQKQILNFLNERNFITVKELSAITFTSQSSIRRDLTYLENNGLAKRLHGGVSSIEPITSVASYYDRLHKSANEKRIIAQKASKLLKEGQTVLLDSSSTSTFLLPYIAKIRNITVFTNNLSTAMHAVEMGIKIHCLGGEAINGTTALSGSETFMNLENIFADICFFSSQSINAEGNISDSTEQENLVRKMMLKSAKVSVFLCDSVKFNTQSTYKLCNLDNIDYAVFDKLYDDLKTDCTIF